MKPGYKQTEVGVIPEEWEVKRLGEVASVKTGPFGSTLHESDYVQNGTPIITVEHLGEFGVEHINLPLVSEYDRKRLKVYSLEIGDIVFSRVGSIDRNALIRPSENGWLFSGRLLRVRPNEQIISSPFLSYQFHGERFISEVRSVAVGQTMASLNTQILNSIRVALPPLPEQIAIAEVLSDMDALIASTEALISKKRALKQAAMQQLLTGQTRLPGFHGEWEVKRLGEVGEIDPENIGSYPPNYSFNYIALEDVTRGTLTSYTYHILSTAPSRARRKLRVGDILFATVRPNLQSHLLFVKSTDNWVCSTGFCVIRSLQKLALPEFIYFHLFFSYVNKQIDSLLTGSNYPAINSRDVGNLTIPLPPLPEQIAIAEVLSDMDAELDALASQLAKTRALKQGMMQELLTGRTRLIPKPTESASHAE